MRFSRLQSGINPARKPNFKPGGTIPQQGVQQTSRNGFRLGLVYRAEHRCKSRRAHGRGLSRPPPGAKLGREAAQYRRFLALPLTRKNLNPFGCIGIVLSQQDPVVFFWPRGFLEAWGTNSQKPHISKHMVVFWPCRRGRQGPFFFYLLKLCGS